MGTKGTAQRSTLSGARNKSKIDSVKRPGSTAGKRQQPPTGKPGRKDSHGLKRATASLVDKLDAELSPAGLADLLSRNVGTPAKQKAPTSTTMSTTLRVVPGTLTKKQLEQQQLLDDVDATLALMEAL
ncbi:hypothetical protein HDU82_003342 [Entophlyctis luteolus]|nr:hypothetical protein HDU82_003342 [Entophlyctis luteolus]